MTDRFTMNPIGACPAGTPVPAGRALPGSASAPASSPFPAPVAPALPVLPGPSRGAGSRGLRRGLLLALLCLAGLPLLGAQAAASEPETYPGTGNGPTRDQAILAARTAAIQAATARLQWDPLQTDIFLTEYPGGVRTLEETAERTLGGAWKAVVRISLDFSARNLAQLKYSAQAATLLNQAAEALAQARSRLAEAEAHESQADIGAAWTAWTQAQRLVDQSRDLIVAIRSTVPLSDQGLTADNLRSQAAALAQTTLQGLERLQEVQDRLVADEAGRLIARTIDSLEALAAGLEQRLAVHRNLSPYYDLDPVTLGGHVSSLDDLIIDVQGARDQAQETQGALDPGQDFYRTRISLLVSSLDTLEDRARSYRGAAQRELSRPRIQRQADAEEAARRREALARFGRDALWHENTHTVELLLALPWLVGAPEGMDSRPAATAFQFQAQRVFDKAWLATRTRVESWPTGNDTRQAALVQDVDLALRLPLLVGLGYGWDWHRWDSAVANPGALHRIRAHLGTVRWGETWPESLLTLSWTLPPPGQGLDLAFLANASLEGSFNFDNVVILRGRVWNFPLEARQAPGNKADEAWVRSAGWQVGARFIVGPWVSEVGYTGNGAAPLTDPSGAGYKSQGWYFTLAYGW